MGSIVRTAVRGIVNDLVGQYEGTAIHKGEHIERAVRDALDDHDIQDMEEQEREEQERQEHQQTDLGSEVDGDLPERAVADGGEVDE
ncbi:hypothetical protein [Halorientalis pallida]|uniref:hypothetical protein n=1 Tax=Halorientalis pallida TaxID=2479928 RepID=UPI00187D429F|nr:hypothetical protein [Halorientalis pallida]